MDIKKILDGKQSRQLLAGIHNDWNFRKGYSMPNTQNMTLYRSIKDIICTKHNMAPDQVSIITIKQKAQARPVS